MATEAQVANLAAVTIGTEARLTSLDEDVFVARTLKSVWEVERKATIRDGMWNFAIKRGSLAAEAGVPAALLYPWSHRYPLPAECLRLVEVLGCSARDDYTLEGRKILCRVSGPLYVRYAADVAEPAQWDDAFARAFAYRLALSCGHRIAGSAFDSVGAQDKYEEAINRAARIDGTENPPIEQEDGTWITARLCGSYGRRAGWEIP